MPFTSLPTPVSCPPSPRVEQLASTSSTPLAHPDSTHQPYTAPFTEGEDILVHDPDGLIYFGILVEVDHDQGQCLVRFGDSTERWANFYDLRRLEEEESSLNVSEDGGTSKVTGLEQFHQELSRQLSQTWQHANNEETEKEIKLPDHVIKARSKLSYDFDSLVWDAAHQINQTDTYCYCGEKGDWYKKMLQCQDCLQWFHQECIRSLTYPLMCGDRFFKFTCTLCNGKEEESIQRLDMGMVDALHLVIFNLIISKNQKYHQLETSIIPLLKKKIKYLTDGGSNTHIKLSQLTSEQIYKHLGNNKSRFKCGSETGQQSCFWGLRKLVAPWLPSKYLLYKPSYCKVNNSLKRLKETLIQPNNKKGVFQDSKQRKTAMKDLVKSSLKRGRAKDLATDFSDSDTSSFGTLDLLIKPPKDFSGANNPFRLSSECAEHKTPASGEVSGVATPNSTETDSTIKMFLGDKESPVSSGPASHVTEECGTELLQSVEEILNESSDSGNINSDDVFKTPTISISELKSSLTSYFAPNAKTRIVGGNAFSVKARRLTLNGDIAYLINWEPNTMFDN